VSPEQIKQLRAELKCTARELAGTIELPVAEVQAWEAGTKFPTKQWVTRLETLRSKGPAAIARKPSKQKGAAPLELLNTPELWQILRKLLVHQKLYTEVSALAASYADPLDRSEAG
jgi:transcriptional regulator with XRE-family HTH domain